MITGTALDGTALDLAKYRGKPLVAELLGLVVRTLPRGVPAVQGPAGDPRRAGRAPGRRRPVQGPARARPGVPVRLRRVLAVAHRPGRVDRRGVPRRRAAPDVLHRQGRRPARDPDRRGPAGGLRHAVREDPPVTVPVAPAIRATGLHKSYGGREVLGGVSFEVRPASCSPCSVPTAPGRPRRSRSSRATGAPTRDRGGPRAGSGPRRPAAAAADRADAPGGRRGPADHAPRGAPPVRPAFPGRGGPGRAPRAASGLGRVATTRYRRLSGGEKQRLGLALALIGRPELLVLDEPTAGMDPAAKQATRERIAALRAAGTTILLTTHELGDVELLADQVAVLDRGRIVASGTPAELTGAGAPRIRFRLSSPLDAADLVALPRHWRRRRAGREVVAAGAGSHYELTGLAEAPDPALVAALAAWCADRGLLITELRLARRASRSATSSSSGRASRRTRRPEATADDRDDTAPRRCGHAGPPGELARDGGSACGKRAPARPRDAARASWSRSSSRPACCSSSARSTRPAGPARGNRWTGCSPARSASP